MTNAEIVFRVWRQEVVQLHHDTVPFAGVTRTARWHIATATVRRALRRTPCDGSGAAQRTERVMRLCASAMSCRCSHKHSYNSGRAGSSLHHNGFGSFCCRIVRQVGCVADKTVDREHGTRASSLAEILRTAKADSDAALLTLFGSMVNESDSRHRS